MNCLRCSAPLPRYCTRYCSQRCSGLAHGDTVRLPRQVCLYPPCQRSYAPWKRTQKFCSRPCADAGMARGGLNLRARKPRTTSHDVLSILEGNRLWWLTVSDLAIWIFGSDDKDDCHAIRSAIYRLRQWGYAIESRVAIWADTATGPAFAFRLAAVAVEIAA